ncbi:MAG: hypothetical protein KGS72_25340 [Cyanobacteria bacterium REEB67]|nr:hypothetical protein [Cyanobacteria bacterium REEB67]
MTVSNGLDVVDKTAISGADANSDTMGVSTVHAIYNDSAAFRAAMLPADNKSADQALGNLTLVDAAKSVDCTSGPAAADQTPSGKGFWARLGESFAAYSYAEAGMVPPEALTAPAQPPASAEVCTRPAQPGMPQANNSDAAGLSGDGSRPTPSSDSSQSSGPNGPGFYDSALSSEDSAPPSADAAPPSAKPADAPAVRLDLNGPGADAGTTSTGGDMTVRLGPGASGQALDQPAAPAAPAAPGKPGQENLNKVLGSVLNNIGKPVQELEPGINPRLGCARMLSHTLHEADPTFPETNNTADFRRALKAHGYEEVTVKPGDPALAQSHAGDVIVGSRPDGMPSHVALSMGDGTVFNNNSDSGKGQIDSLDQFNQGMHDKSGHWQKNGFSAVTIFRKKDAAAAPSTISAVPDPLFV